MKLFILILLAVGVFSQATKPYVEMAPADFTKNTVIATARNYGASFVANKALQAGKISSAKLTVTKVHHVFNQTNTGFTNYRFDLSLKANNNDTLNTVFTVKYNLSSQARSIISYNYNISYASKPVTKPPIIKPPVTKPPVTKPPVQPPVTTPPVQPPVAKPPIIKPPVTKPPVQPPVTTPPVQPPVTTLPATNNSGSTGAGWVAIPTSQYNATLIQELVNYGKDIIVQKAVAAAKVPAGTYTVSKINSATKQTLKDGANYKFNIRVKNADATRELVAAFIVNYKTATNVKSIITQNYQVVPYKL